MAGNESLETFGSWLEKARYSSNYAIDSNGRIGLFVNEEDRSRCTSSPENDHRAITIEVANNGGEPDWPVSDKAYKALIVLLTDVCKRNNIKQLLWRGDKSLIGQVEKQNMTVHRWYRNKACPGNYLYERHGEIARLVNTNLEEDDNMDISKLTDDQIDQLIARMNERLAEKPAPDWAESELREATDMEITDGKNPMGLTPRYQTAIMVKRGVKKAKEMTSDE
jgi:hypothetical protein